MTTEQYINKQAVELSRSEVSPAYAVHLLSLIRPEHRAEVRRKVFQLLSYKAATYGELWEVISV